MTQLFVRLFHLFLAAALAIALGSFAPWPARADIPPYTPTAPVQGTLVAEDGTAPPRGTVVKLVAWAPDDELAAVPDGGDTRSLVVATARSLPGGDFALYYLDTPELAGYTDADGAINFTVEATAEEEEYVYSLTRTYAAGAVGADPFVVEGIPSPGAQPEEFAAPASARAASTSAIIACIYFKLKTYAPRWVTVGDASTVTGATAKLTYTRGASSTIGAGVSVSGAVGSFKASGSSKVSSTVGIGFPPISGNASAQWRTEFIFAKFGYRCVGDPAGKYRKYVVSAVEFVGGTQLLTQATPTATHCVPYAAKSDYFSSSQKAITWTKGATVSSDIGVNLSSQTGFDTKTKLWIHVDVARHICGTNANPNAAARVVVKP